MKLRIFLMQMAILTSVPKLYSKVFFARMGAEWEYWNLTDQTYYEAKSGEIIVTGRYKAKIKPLVKSLIHNLYICGLWKMDLLQSFSNMLILIKLLRR